jgi:hypothetical protein
MNEFWPAFEYLERWRKSAAGSETGIKNLVKFWWFREIFAPREY